MAILRKLITKLLENGQEHSAKPASRRGQPGNLHLQVVTGVHRGVMVTLDRSAFSIGSSHRTDIVLRDDGIALEHAIMRDEGTAVRIDATGGDVFVDQRTIPTGFGRRVRLPAEVVIGGVHLRISRAAFTPIGYPPPVPQELIRAFPGDGYGRMVSQPKRSLAATLLKIAGALAIFALLISTLFTVPRTPHINIAQAKAPPTDTNLGGAGRVAGDSRSNADAHSVDNSEQITNDPSIEAPIAPARNSINSPPVVTTDQAAQELTARIASANIRTLKVASNIDRLTVSGTLTKPQAIEWAAIQQWFDQNYGSHIVLAINITDIDGRAMPRLQLQAIWHGEHPYIITADGQHYYRGAVIENGWIVQEIADDRLVLAKGADTVTLKY
ncbi:MAG: hypothetical protein FWD68_13375 [Alphaproteobacteria bacterium]|nr:hypothetical protein [Alphaproteobacteria bacterium]